MVMGLEKKRKIGRKIEYRGRNEGTFREQRFKRTPAPLKAFTPPTLMAEEKGYGDGPESNLLRSHNQQKCDAHR
ncbi:unnamed protein product [Brassica napus]|uniref:(rape) hypothetical protein n=1 Tax=Brassica napus TaxID=3708 RepID=A0A816Z2M9_BRANA|nr:unnamed protein product [Brassica napus]